MSQSGSGKKNGYQLTKRDGSILCLLAHLDKLDTSHICKLLFRPDPTTGRKYHTVSAQAIRRLEHLRDAKLIQSERPPLIEGRQGLPFAHSLTPKGYTEAAIIKGVDVQALDRPKTLISTKSMHYFHYKKSMDVLTDALLAAQLSGLSMPYYKTPRTLKEEAAGGYHADCYFAHSFNARLLHLFCETDLASEHVTRWEEKVSAAAASWNSETFRTHYLSPEIAARYTSVGLRVLVITTTETRREQLIEATIRAKCGTRFWFTTFERLNPETFFTDPIWTIATREGLHCLGV